MITEQKTESTRNKMSIDEVVATFSQYRPQWQVNENTAWLNQLHSLMKEGAVWASPGLGTIYQKCGDGFVKLKEFP